MIKIVIYGSESTGKTTLAQDLAHHFDTVWVPEYARQYLQEKYNQTGEICTYEDLMPIAQGQLALEQKYLQKARHNLLFCDTNILQTYYYGKAYYNNFKYPALWNTVKENHYDLYLLTYIDTKWVADDLRDKPDDRENMHRLFEQSLMENQLPYKLIAGSRQARLKKAVARIDELLK